VKASVGRAAFKLAASRAVGAKGRLTMNEKDDMMPTFGQTYERLKEEVRKLPPMTPEQRFENALDFSYGNLALSSRHKPSKSAFRILAIQQGGWSEDKFEAWALDKEWWDPEAPETPGWVAACTSATRLWMQDETCWRDDVPSAAWKRLFGEDYPGGVRALARYDVGDAEFFLFQGGRVAKQSYPGNNAIYRIPV
jgi:hypothetical protein